MTERRHLTFQIPCCIIPFLHFKDNTCMNLFEDPYRPPKIDKVGRTKPIVTWRVVMGRVFQVLGLVLIAIPLLAIINEFFRSGFKNPSLDFWVIVIAVFVYLALGCWFLNLAKKISIGRQLLREEVDQRGDF